MNKLAVLVVISLAVGAFAQTCDSYNGDCYACTSNGCSYCSSGTCMTLNSPACVQANEDNTLYNSIGNCPDPCSGSETCQECEGRKSGKYSCAWCMSGSGCRAGKINGTGTVTGSCSDFRLAPAGSTATANQLCAMSFQQCSTITDCFSCANTAQSLSVGCSWCKGSNACITTGSQCSSGVTTNAGECGGIPLQQSSAVAVASSALLAGACFTLAL